MLVVDLPVICGLEFAGFACVLIVCADCWFRFVRLVFIGILVFVLSSIFVWFSCWLLVYGLICLVMVGSVAICVLMRIET